MCYICTTVFGCTAFNAENFTEYFYYYMGQNWWLYLIRILFMDAPCSYVQTNSIPVSIIYGTLHFPPLKNPLKSFKSPLYIGSKHNITSEMQKYCTRRSKEVKRERWHHNHIPPSQPGHLKEKSIHAISSVGNDKFKPY